MPDPRVVLITGASSGVGRTTARLLSERQYKVFGTSRDPASAEIIPGVEMLHSTCAATTRSGRAWRRSPVEAAASTC